MTPKGHDARSNREKLQPANTGQGNIPLWQGIPPVEPGKATPGELTLQGVHRPTCTPDEVELVQALEAMVRELEDLAREAQSTARQLRGLLRQQEKPAQGIPPSRRSTIRPRKLVGIRPLSQRLQRHRSKSDEVRTGQEEMEEIRDVLHLWRAAQGLHQRQEEMARKLAVDLERLQARLAAYATRLTRES